MTPSPYEAQAWLALQNHRTGRGGTGFVHAAAQATADWAGRTAQQGAEYADRNRVARKVKEVAGKGSQALGRGATKIAEGTPAFVVDAGKGATRAIVRLTQVGLTPARVVRKHQKKGHLVDSLMDVRSIDLEQADLVLGRNRDLAYSSFAAVVGGASSFIITGSEIVIVAGAGAAAAPGGAAIAGAFAADTALVLAAASRAVSEISLLYGYDPADPSEKPFLLSVINLGTAVSATTRAAALADLSRLTQLLVRGATWKMLNEQGATKLAHAFAARFGVRLTKKGLGKAVPGLGIAIGASLNWFTLELIVDSANIAYRRRWLLEKYPELAGEDRSLDPDLWEVDDTEADDTPISVLDLMKGLSVVRGERPGVIGVHAAVRAALVSRIRPL